MGTKVLCIITAIILSVGIVKADYLVVSRSATIKELPKGNAVIKHRVKQGEYLILLKEQQQNGYFYIKVPETNIEGWIYRTLVRRYEGEFTQSNVELNTYNDLIVDVLDVGAGLCNLITLPGGKYLIYDAGHWQSSGTQTLKQIKEIIPVGSEIELMILSHSDADHIGAAGNIINTYRVKKVVHTGFETSLISNANKSNTYRRFETALSEAAYPIDEVNLFEEDSVIKPGLKSNFGDVTLTYLCGFAHPLQEWDLSLKGEKINSVSIIAKVTYHGKSILFGGDAVGRHIGSNEDEIIATEKYLIENAGDLLDSDVLIAPHHGADNGNSKSFIEKTSPEYVIFSAGHDYNHPRQIVADRYLELQPQPKIFRTDLGDDERMEDESYSEWLEGRIEGCKDPYADDNIRIIISEYGKINVRYIGDNCGCND